MLGLRERVAAAVAQADEEFGFTIRANGTPGCATSYTVGTTGGGSSQWVESYDAALDLVLQRRSAHIADAILAHLPPFEEVVEVLTSARRALACACIAHTDGLFTEENVGEHLVVGKIDAMLTRLRGSQGEAEA